MKKTITFFKKSVGSISSLHAFNFKRELSALRLLAFIVVFLGFTANNAWGQTTVNYAMSSMGLTNATAVGTTVRNTTDSKITFSFAQNSSANAPTYYTSGAAVRCYQRSSTSVVKGGSIKIMVASGYKITSVTITKVSASKDGIGPVDYVIDGNSTVAGSFADGTTSNATGTISATSSVEFYSTGTASGKRMYVSAISVTYVADATPVATPTFSPAAGTYTTTQSVSLSSTTSGAKIYYTTNGTDPSSASTLYSSAINVSATTTIKAIAYDSNDANPSEIATAAYTINASAPTISVIETISPFSAQVNSSSQSTIHVNASNLTGDINLALSGTNQALFLLDKTSISPAGGSVTDEVVTITYSPTSAGSHSATLTLSSAGATNVTESLTGTAVFAEPTNQPTGLTATANSSSQITVTWTDASGTQAPTGYLVKAAIDPSSPTAPVDGTAETVGTLVKIVTQGTQPAVFTGLGASTTYNFSIWPYTNSGAAIDYKTDGTIATASATTETPLGVPVATAATDVTPTGFTANWGAAASATGYELSVLKKDSEICNNPNEFFNETFGSNSANTDYSINNTFSTTSTNYIDSPENVSVNFSGDGKVGKNTTNPSTTYLGASGNSGAFRSNSSGTSTTVLLKISNIKIKDFQNIALSFGLYYTNGAIGSSSTVSVEYEIDGTGAKTFVFTQPSSTAVWTLCNGNINGSGSSLDLTFKLSTTGGYTARVDDIILKGCPVTPIPGSPFTVTETSKAVSGLNPGTEYFYTVVAKNASGSSVASNEISVTTPKITFTGTGEWTETARWNTGTVPGTTAQVVVDGDAIINSNVEVAGLTINAGKSLTVNAAKQLTISGAATNNGTITIQSDANGTGTIKGDVSGAATVHQHLSSYRTWYLSSPVSNVAPSNMDRYKFYDETTGNWSTTAPAQTIGAGFLAVPTDNTVTSTSFTGTLNSGNVSIDVTRSVGNGAKPGFNLVGNPYPSYLDWSKVNDANGSLMPTSTMWYRTKKRNQSDELVYQFWTVNGNGVGSPSGASQYIPPMQAFWVRAKASGQLQLTNDMRSHAVGDDYLLKAPAANRRTLIRLELSNGTNTDETVLYLSDNANNGLDAFDAPKMSNEDATIAEIFTRAGNEKLVINALQTLPKDTEIALGFEAGSATSFTLRANELSNLPTDVKLILKDNVTKAETDLTDGTAVYSFGDIATSGDRFSIIFRTAGAITGIDQPTFSGLTAYSNANNQLTVLYDGAIDAQTVVSVYNAVGQRLVTQSLKGVSTVIDGEFAPGVYVVKVNNLSRKLTIKK